MISYQKNDPKGWLGNPQYGAALGRSTKYGDPDYSEKLILRKIRIDSGGYDCNGTYFGIGSPLYWYASEDGSIDAVTRATDRNDAKEQIREKYPQAKFFR